MYPHFFGFDLSAALPWTVGGFLLGVLLTALWRGLGIGRASSTQLQTALFDLNALRSTRDEREEFTTKLQSDFGFLEMALAEAERRAASAQTLITTNANLSKSEAETRAAWTAASAELATLKSALQAQTARSTTLEQRLQFISAESTAASAASETRVRELEKLRSDFAAAEARARELEKLRIDAAAFEAQAGEVLNLRRELAAAANALHAVPKLKSDYNTAASEIETLRAELEKRGTVSAVSKRDFDTAMQDLIATRNLTIKQAGDIKALRAACEKLEAEIASRSASSGRGQGFASRTHALKTRRRNAFRKMNGQAALGKRAAAKGKSNGHGVLLARTTLSQAPGAIFLSKGGKWRGAALQRGAGRVWTLAGRSAHMNGLNGAANGSANPAHSDGRDVAELKARVTSLSEELENYRRLRDAVVAANRIAAGDA